MMPLVSLPLPQIACVFLSQPSQIAKWKNPAIPFIASNLPLLVPIKNAQLLGRSLTHKSWAAQQAQNRDVSCTTLKNSGDGGCNRALELLGDGVLALYSIEVLTRRHPGFSHSALHVSNECPRQCASQSFTTEYAALRQ